MKYYYKKIIFSTLITALVAFPFATSAFWGFGDISLDPIQDESGIATQISQVEQVINQVQMVLKAFGLDVVIYKVSQKMSQKLLAKVLNKANGGADGEGSKLFVENFGKYFEDISNQQLSAYTSSLSNSSSPFARSISMGISNSAGGNAQSAKSLLESFSLDKTLPEGTKWQDVGKDISLAGDNGWDFYGQLSQPQNTPLGAAIIAQDDLAKKISSAQETAKTELTSSGFRPDKEASKYKEMFSGFGGGTKGGSGPQAEGPGGPSADAAAGATYYGPGGNPNDSSTASTAPIPYQTEESFSSVNLDGNIKTPTKTNEDQSGQAVTEAFDRLRNADSFGKILFSTIQQMITGLVQKGFSKLGSDGGTSGQLYGGRLEVARGNQSWTNAPEQVVDLRSSLDSGITKTQLEIAAIEKTIVSVKKPVSDDTIFNDDYSPRVKGTVLSLEVCIPGPDTGYDRRLTDYMTQSTRDTQQSSSKDNEKGTQNNDALVKIRSNVTQAIAEQKALATNPFLNIPAATTMKSLLDDYYKSARRFRGLVDSMIVKRQVLNSLLVLRAETQAQGTLANANVPLILFDAQWKKMSAVEKNSLYTRLTPSIISGFPEYLAEATAGGGAVALSPLPANNPSTDINERDEEMKNRIFDEQWIEWETKVPDTAKQKIYSRYIGLTQDISDSATVQKAQVVADSTDELYNELRDVLHDCALMRTYLAAHPSPSEDEIKILTGLLKSDRVRNGFSGPSILTARENDVDFEKLNERIIGGKSGSEEDSFGLQVRDLAQDPLTILQQDKVGDLFCRLTNYELRYVNFIEDRKVSGVPMGCQPPNPIYFKPGSRPVKPAWYHTNNGEILFLTSDAE